MLSLFYIPVALYNILYNLVFRPQPQTTNQIKYSKYSEQKKQIKDAKIKSQSEVEQLEDTAERQTHDSGPSHPKPVEPEPDQRKPEPDDQVAPKQPEHDVIKPTPPPPQVEILLSESEEDIEIEPAPPSTPVITEPPHPDSSSSSSSPSPEPYQTPSTRPPNSFIHLAKPGTSSSSSPDTELPSYNGELEYMGANNDHTTSVNPASAVAPAYNMEENWDVDIPVMPSSLTSQKNAPIKKYVPKTRTKPRRSDLEWNQYMEKCMLAGSRGKILNSFRQCFREATDSYRLCCDLLITFGITHSSGRTVYQRGALEELLLWKKDVLAVRPSLSNQLKALDVSYLCNTSLFPALLEIYELDTVPPQDCVILIRDKLEHKPLKYIKHMAFIISQLNLQEYFDTVEMLLPLLSMDKLMTIEAYLADKEIAGTFVSALDALLEPTGTTQQTLMTKLEGDYSYTRSTAQFKFSPDQLTTLIKRMIKLHGLDGGVVAPNLFLEKTVSNLKSILYCRYRKGYTEDWTDTLISTVGSNPTLQHALFTELVTYEDLQYAAQLHRLLSPSEGVVPPRLRDYLRTAPLAPDPGVSDASREVVEVREVGPPEESADDGVLRDLAVFEGYLGLPSAVPLIIDVASPAALARCLTTLSLSDVIGLDSEWRAALDPTRPAPVSILQLAAPSSCFLLDVPAILATCPDLLVVEFSEKVFRGSSTVIGYALSQDLIKLRETCPVLGDRLSSHPNLIDLAIAHKHVNQAERLERSKHIQDLVRQNKPLPATAASTETGLSRLCEIVLGAPLNKTYQISDWARRPLLEAQRSYAALDAYVLLHLYRKLSEQFYPVSLGELTEQVVEVREDPGSIAGYIPRTDEPTPSYLLRVVVDVPCQGLGKKLRHIGVDCVILEDSQSLDDAAKISLAEGRIILSRDSNSEKLTRLTDPGRVYKVLGRNATEQLAEIRSHFNLVVNEEDLFSRCAICNSAYFIKLQPGQAKEMKEAQELYNTTSQCEVYEVYERRMKSVEYVSVSKVGLTQYGVRLQLDKVRMDKFEDLAVINFWGCSDCGKMYWDWLHIRNFNENIICNMFKLYY